MLEWDEDATSSTTLGTTTIPCDDVILAIGQENAFPWIERDLGIEFGEWDMPVVDETTMAVDAARASSSAATPPGVRRTSSGPSPTATRRRSPSTTTATTSPVTDRPAQGMNLVSQKMGMSEWSYHNDYNPSPRQKMTHVELTKRFESLNLEVELGFSAEQTAREVQRCLNCDVETAFTAPLCIECDACIDICPVQCLTITSQRRRGRPARSTARRRPPTSTRRSSSPSRSPRPAA